MISTDWPDPEKNCPSPDVLIAYAAGKLPPQQRERVAAHVDSCPACQSALAEMRVDIPSEHPPQLPRRMGHYELLEEIAHYGMAVVYKARHTATNGVVALKIIGIIADTDHDWRRVRVEAEAMARVLHPNVAQLREVGETDGHPYICMEYVDGGTLASRIGGQGLTLLEAAQIVRMLAEAIHAAHEQRVIHCDLKQGNVLLAAAPSYLSEVAGALFPKLVNFDLAILQDQDATHPAPGAILGTPVYMAPEQALGKSKDIGPRTDVYGVGAILYESLTGRRPFKGASRIETIELVCNKEPIPPRKLRPEIPRDLEAVCLRCLAKKPAARYPSAQELALDLNRWLRKEPVLPRPRPWCARLGRRLPKRTAVILLLLLCGVIAWLRFFPSVPLGPDKEIESKLAKGERVTLIGEKGWPAWSRFRTGNESAQTSLANDGVFTICTWGLTCLELVHDSPIDSYRIRAEVRHEKGAMLGAVGLFCGMQEFPLADSTAYFFIRLAYDDIGDIQKEFAGIKSPPNVDPPPPPIGNSVFLGPHIHWECKSGPPMDARIGELNPQLFHPAGPLPTGQPWRQLSLVVTPEGVRATWAEEELVGEKSAQTIDRDTEQFIFFRTQQNVRGQFPAGQSPRFNPRAPCGLYVHNSAASFRNVVIEPLTERRNGR